MSDLRIVFTRSKSEDGSIRNTPPANDQPSATPSITENQRHHESVGDQPGPHIGRIWAFSGNLDKLALRYGQSDITNGYYELVHDLFTRLRESDDPSLAQSSFLMWADGYSTLMRGSTQSQPDQFWMFYVTADDLQPKLEQFIKACLKTDEGWTETGSGGQLPRESFPMFEYAKGEVSIFFATLQHPNGQRSIGSPELFYDGNEAVLGFGRVPGKLKRVTLADEANNPLAFNVRIMDEIIPGCLIKVDNDLPPLLPCGLTEEELIERTYAWETLTEEDKNLLRTYGPPVSVEPDVSSEGDRDSPPPNQEDFDRSLVDQADQSDQPRKKISPLVLYERENEEMHSILTVKVDRDGNLVFEGQDIGEYVEKLRGRDEYEYKLIVDGKYKDSILLHLIKDRFKGDVDFRKWLEAEGIPSRFYSWP